MTIVNITSSPYFFRSAHSPYFSLLYLHGEYFGRSVQIMCQDPNPASSNSCYLTSTFGLLASQPNGNRFRC